MEPGDVRQEEPLNCAADAAKLLIHCQIGESSVRASRKIHQGQKNQNEFSPAEGATLHMLEDYTASFPPVCLTRPEGFSTVCGFSHGLEISSPKMLRKARFFCLAETRSGCVSLSQAIQLPRVWIFEPFELSLAGE